MEEINRAAGRVACRAAQGKDVYVAGSVGPLGLDAEEARARGIDRGHCFREQIAGLLEGGVDLIFFETFMDYEEMEIAFLAGKEVDAGPAICSFACSSKGELASGVSLAEAFAKLRALGAGMMGVNCMNDPQEMIELRQHIPPEYMLAVYPTAGFPKHQQGRFIYEVEPDSFAKSARELVAQGVRLVGGCCGSSPKHVAAIAAAIENLQPST